MILSVTGFDFKKGRTDKIISNIFELAGSEHFNVNVSFLKKIFKPHHMVF